MNCCQFYPGFRILFSINELVIPIRYFTKSYFTYPYFIPRDLNGTEDILNFLKIAI